VRAIVEGAKEAGAPAVMVGTSEGEADFIGMTEAVALVKAMREELNFPIFLNSDHYKSVEKCKAAIDAGYDTILIDTSKLGYEENIAAVQQVVAYAKASGREIPVEGEIGYLRGSSEIQQKVEISVADYTQPEQAQDFAAKSGVDRLAVVFGNIHGIVTEQEEKLDVDHFKKIASALPEMAFVLHGASGLKDEDVAAAIKAGISNVHFNTELRVAYAQTIEKVLTEKHETTPYKYLGPADQAVKELVMKKTHLFMGR
jgi:ketose-bisphosphate aldolase